MNGFGAGILDVARQDHGVVVDVCGQGEHRAEL